MDNFGYTKESNFENIANAIREKNGKSDTYLPSEMASAIEELKVGELDFSGIFDQESADELNLMYKDAIARSIDINNSWYPNNNTLNITYNNDVVFLNIDTSNVTNAYYGLRDNYYLEIANLDLSKCTDIRGLFYQNFALRKANILNINNNVKSLYQLFYHCYNLEEIPNIDYSKIVNFVNAFQYCRKIKGDVVIDTSSATDITNMAGYWKCANSLTLTNIENVTTATYSFIGNSTPIIRFSKWKQTNISLADSGNLSAESIHYIIQNAVNVADGATARTLTLHATAKKNWQNSEYYQQDLAVLEQKGITIA